MIYLGGFAAPISRNENEEIPSEMCPGHHPFTPAPPAPPIPASSIHPETDIAPAKMLGNDFPFHVRLQLLGFLEGNAPRGGKHSPKFAQLI